MSSTPPVACPSANRRILIVDDNPAIHDDFRKILCPVELDTAEIEDLRAALFDRTPKAVTDDYFELTSAFQGQEALELVKRSVADEQPFAMAFLDVRMPPGWDGIETAARLWEVCPDLQLVICTAYSDYSWDEMRARLRQPDGLVILKKPFDNVEVQQLAHALTKKWHLNGQAMLKMAELEKMVQQRTKELANSNESLTASEERFSKAFQASPIASGIQTLDGRRFVDVNDGLVTLTGCSRDELLGRSSQELFMWVQPDLVDQWFDAVARQEGIKERSTKVRHQSGGVRDVVVSLVPVSLGGQPHVLLLAQDVSERLLLERQFLQAQKMEGIGQLAAGVAHDFNNILTVIQGHAGMLKAFLPEPSPAAKSVHQILTTSNRAATLIRQLLTFSRKQVMQFRSLDFNEVLSACLPMMERLMGEHIQVEFRGGALIPSVHADVTMIEQIVMNLSANARDAMPNGGRVIITTDLVEVQREATPMDPEKRTGAFVCMSFTDTGCGMNPEVLSCIFEPFYTTKAVGQGTGLGLATVFGIVRQHRGWLEVESQPGHGSTFRMYFQPCDQPAKKQEEEIHDLPAGGSETILVAEDEDALREMVAAVLTSQGYKVFTAASGREALEVWERAQGTVDLLLTDMVMPEGIMGGELAENLTARNSKLKVIFTSGFSPGMAGKDISLIEGRNFLPKPYSIAKLAKFVRQCLTVPTCPS